MVSAPVSRDIPDATGRRESHRKITLTPQEIEMARVSNISVEEYARQKLKLSQTKLNELGLGVFKVSERLQDHPTRTQ